MAKNPSPVHPRIKDARLYERTLRRTYLNPMFANLRGRMAKAQDATQAWRAMDQTVEDMLAMPRSGVPVQTVEANIRRMEKYHRERIKKSFRSALALDISPVLSEPEIASFLNQQVIDNVNLIKTLPSRMHANLKKRFHQLLRDSPFDQKRVQEMVGKEFGSTGYNLRRIVRDQTNKTIGGLTEIRHRQLGVDEYQWLTAQDERVRRTHQANSGLTFSWSNPPAGTGHPGHDINCRCVPQAILTDSNRLRIKESVEGPQSVLADPGTRLAGVRLGFGDAGRPAVPGVRLLEAQRRLREENDAIAKLEAKIASTSNTAWRGRYTSKLQEHRDRAESLKLNIAKAGGRSEPPVPAPPASAPRPVRTLPEPEPTPPPTPDRDEE